MIELVIIRSVYRDTMRIGYIAHVTRPAAKYERQAHLLKSVFQAHPHLSFPGASQRHFN